MFAYTWAFGGVLHHVDGFDDSHMTSKEKSDPLTKVSQEFQSLLRELFNGGHQYGMLRCNYYCVVLFSLFQDNDMYPR